MSHTVTRSQDENMRNIGGLSERFSGLERLLREIRACVQEQGDLAQVGVNIVLRGETLN